MKTLTCEELRAVVETVFRKIATSTSGVLEFPEDYYRIIPTESWNRFDEPVIHSCSLYDDVDELRNLAVDPNRHCTFVDLDRLASVLRAISHMFDSV